MPKKIFILDDDASVREFLGRSLPNEGFDVVTFDLVSSFMLELQNNIPALVILDAALKDSSGLDVCKQIRNSSVLKNLPIIILSARSEEIDKVLGLEMGADDYITKPFSMRELVARIKSLLRRTKDETIDDLDKISCRDIVIYINRRLAYKNDIPIELTYKEFELLRLLVENRGKVLTRNYIINRIWGFNYIGETRTIDVHIRHIRQLLGSDDYIETIRGVGYKFKESEGAV